MYNVLFKLQHFSNVKFYDSLQDFRKSKWSNEQFVNLSLAQKYGSFRKGTNIHKTDFRSIENYYQNVWISGLISENIFICQDYGNDSYWNSKWREKILGSEFNPSLGVTFSDLYLIDVNKVVMLGKHNLLSDQIRFYADNINGKRPFDISFHNKNQMNVKLRWRNLIVSGNYEVEYYTKMR